MAIYKNGSYAFDINAKTEGVYHSTFIFSTQDINTAKLIFYLRKDGIPLPLSAVTGKVVLIPSSGKQRIRDVTIVDPFEGIAEYVLDEDEIKMYGKFNCQLILKYTNGQSPLLTNSGLKYRKVLWTRTWHLSRNITSMISNR